MTGDFMALVFVSLAVGLLLPNFRCFVEGFNLFPAMSKYMVKSMVFQDSAGVPNAPGLLPFVDYLG